MICARTALGHYRLWRAVLILLPLLATACAGLQEPLSSDLHAPPAEVSACARWFADLDDAIDGAGVRDGGTYRIPGFPYLRVDRFSASFAAKAVDDDKAFADWVEYLAALDADARGDELRNLPKDRLVAFAQSSDAAAARSDHCRTVLIGNDLTSATQRALLASRATVPDDYSDWQRAVGLYPLVSVPFSMGVRTWQKEMISLVQQANADPGSVAGAADPHGDPIVRYEPAGAAVDAGQIAAIFSSVHKDALGIPRFTPAERATILQAYAPVLEIGTAADYDRFGPLVWRDRSSPSVEPGRPTVYRDVAFTRYGEQVLVQLVYTLWFPERPAHAWGDLLAGRLDGIVFRITLDQTGRPLIYDTIHPCGCYHMFFPTERVAARAAPADETEWAFMPARAPSMLPPQRISITTQTETHFVVRVGADGGGVGIPYDLVDYRTLRALPTAAGTRSVFEPDGLVSGTERGERFLFWPMGVESAGAMREWGRHATAFVGRRHFDSPDLIERRFSIVAPDALSG